VALRTGFRECIQVTDKDQGSEEGENVWRFRENGPSRYE